MDPTNLPEGYYFDEVRGQIERVEKDWIAPDTVAANTFILYHEVSRGLVAHGLCRDELGYLFMGVCKVNETDSNIRYVDFYMAPPGSLAFNPTPFDRWQPSLKTDLIELLCDGRDLIPTATTHAPVSAPRDSNVEASRLVGVCHVKSVSREGPCGPLGIPYFRPGNNLTRGQVAKIIVEALEATGFEFPPYDPQAQVFEDVAVGSTFHEYASKLSSVQAISGYACVPQQP